MDFDDPFLASRRRAQAAEIFARAAAVHERTARRLRLTGSHRAAERVEAIAVVARDRIDQPAATERMYRLVRALRQAPDLDAFLDEAVAGAIALTRTDFGNVQLVDPASGVLRIAAQRGFGDEFLAHFAIVDDDATGCGRAAAARAQAVIGDVTEDPGFAPHRAIAATSRFRAVLSTPLVDASGALRGVLSTHFRDP